MKFLILGCNGMAGHVISLYLSGKGHDVFGFARKKSEFIETIVGDARNLDFVNKAVNEGKYDIIVNCIGLLNQYAENDHEAAVFLNSYFPQYLAKITENTPTQVIQISTDCVFSGKSGGYKETDFPDGMLFYDRSKALGELNDKKNCTLRSSIVGPDIKKEGIGLINWFMQQKREVYGYRNAIWTGQTTLQLSKTVERAAIQHICGLYNMVPENSISKYDMLVLFNKYLRKSPIEIIPEDDFRTDKSLIRTNFKKFSYKIPDYEEQIRELGNWMRKHKYLYPYYDL